MQVKALPILAFAAVVAASKDSKQPVRVNDGVEHPHRHAVRGHLNNAASHSASAVNQTGQAIAETPTSVGGAVKDSASYVGKFAAKTGHAVGDVSLAAGVAGKDATVATVVAGKNATVATVGAGKDAALATRDAAKDAAVSVKEISDTHWGYLKDGVRMNSKDIGNTAAKAGKWTVETTPVRAASYVTNIVKTGAHDIFGASAGTISSGLRKVNNGVESTAEYLDGVEHNAAERKTKAAERSLNNYDQISANIENMKIQIQSRADRAKQATRDAHVKAHVGVKVPVVEVKYKNVDVVGGVERSVGVDPEVVEQHRAEALEQTENDEARQGANTVGLACGTIALAVVALLL